MTTPVRPSHRAGDRNRFSLRTTAVFFLLLAIIVTAVTFIGRTAARVVTHRPVWAAVLAALGIAAALMCRSKWRHFSAARSARRVVHALEEAAETAADSLAAPAAHEAESSTEPPGGLGDLRDLGGDTYSSATVPGVGGREGQDLEWRSLPADADAVLPSPEPPLDQDGEDPTQAICYTALDPDGFEQAIADLCARDACREAEVVGGAGDLGADVVALTEDGRRVVIQCKHYGDGNKVGSQDVQRFGGTCFTIHQADVAVVVTTSDFTAPALEYARQCGIVCVNGQELEAWCHGDAPSPWDRHVS